MRSVLDNVLFNIFNNNLDETEGMMIKISDITKLGGIGNTSEEKEKI